MTNHKNLLPLVARLKACPAHDASVSRELFLESWDELKREDVTPFRTPSLPVMAALVLNDDTFAQLLGAMERAQLVALVKLAVDRYDQQTNPPNKLGRLMAGVIIKKE
jgi:hypothetical protein